MKLESRYQEIQKTVEKLSDFSEEDLASSRNLFDLSCSSVVPKRFEVWTSLVGLPLPDDLTDNLQTLAHQITEKLPPQTRFYTVLPENYHWEVFIIKRPDENVEQEKLQQVPEILKKVLSNYPSFTFTYQGFLITPDGTIITKGYGNFDEIRTQLRQAIPFASPQQSQLGHISLGRILDPVGSHVFAELKTLIRNSWNEFYGELEVNTVQYVYESQWYMEDKEIIAILPITGKRG
jgi:hypothetical protein